MRKIPPGHMERLVNFLIEWGVSGFCGGGGGEPSLNTGVRAVLKTVINRGREFAFVTNGIDLPLGLLALLPLCRWIGFSVDADCENLYLKTKGAGFNRAVDNIRRVIRVREKYYQAGVIKPGNCDISLKYLIVPENIGGIYNACQLAKDLGVNEFHCRPASIDRREIFKGEDIKFNLDRIDRCFARCHELEDKSFKVITSFHKFSKDFHIDNDFKRCYASALQIQCCADGNVYVCQDQRIQPRYLLGSHYPDPENILTFWGKEKHIEILKSTKPNEDCPRCTYGPYNQMCEKVILKDSMCLNFP